MLTKKNLSEKDKFIYLDVYIQIDDYNFYFWLVVSLPLNMF